MDSKEELCLEFLVRLVVVGHDTSKCSVFCKMDGEQIPLLARATIGSFTRGTLVDKIGYKRTFQLNTLHLIVGTLLRSVALSL